MFASSKLAFLSHPFSVYPFRSSFSLSATRSSNFLKISCATAISSYKSSAFIPRSNIRTYPFSEKIQHKKYPLFHPLEHDGSQSFPPYNFNPLIVVVAVAAAIITAARRSTRPPPIDVTPPYQPQQSANLVQKLLTMLIIPLIILAIIVIVLKKVGFFEKGVGKKVWDTAEEKIQPLLAKVESAAPSVDEDHMNFIDTVRPTTPYVDLILHKAKKIDDGITQYRFYVPENSKTLPGELGQRIQFKTSNGVAANLLPVSPLNQQSYMDIVLDLNDTNIKRRLLAHSLENSNILPGDTIQAAPVDKGLTYKGDSIVVYDLKVVCCGTEAITSGVEMMNSLLNDPECSLTKASLSLYATDAEKLVIFTESLEALEEKFKNRVNVFCSWRQEGDAKQIVSNKSIPDLVCAEFDQYKKGDLAVVIGPQAAFIDPVTAYLEKKKKYPRGLVVPL